MKFFTLDNLSEMISCKVSNGVSEYKFLYDFISVNKDFIIKNCSTFSYEDLWYSEYYYLFCEKCLCCGKTGYDAGLEQMLFKLLESISDKIEINWNIINDLEIKAKKLIWGETDESCDSKGN